ncbi:MAG: SpoIIE family protein phosphatase [Firmicutes bacterium]|nr:SpoIIE family protein phosphatase [Bacillota bacterium]
MRKNLSLGKKILYAMLAIVSIMLLLAVLFFIFTMNNLSKLQAETNEELSETTGQMSSEYMSQEASRLLQDMAVEKAMIADEVFSEFENAVCEVAYVAEQIYNNPQDYGPRSVPLPDASKDGELTMQVLYSAKTDPDDPAIKKELALIGNVQDTLMAINANQEIMVSVYVATESGFMVQADYIPAKKYDENGELMPLEAKERPWYRGASILKRPYFTPVTKDAHTPRPTVMCGVPVFRDGELVAVAGAGMYLDNMESFVQSIDVGSGGFAAIMNRDGQILFSTAAEGSLAAVTGGPDIRRSQDAALAQVATNASIGMKGVNLINVDGVPSYIAYAPMKTVGWSLFVVLPQEGVEAPTKQMLESLGSMMDQSMQKSNEQVRNATWVLIGLFGVAVAMAVWIAVRLSQNIVRPIHVLTEKVSAIEGDTLDFTWDLETGDETQTLAESFGSMTRRMNDYIENIRTITAEKERVGAELSLAQRIQESMLPNVFPPFPDRHEFDIYASMDPAKEVGGDFYDYFFIDDDHLGLVMADVSGKGIGAALFMTICMITLKNFATQNLSPAEVLRKTNEMICANNSADMFVTVWIGVLEISTGKLTASNAGHEYPVVMLPGNAYEIVKDKHGFVVGGLEDEEYEDYELQLQPGSKLFLYTDGLPEAKGPGGVTNMFGLERLLGALNADPGATPQQTLSNMNDAVARFVQDEEQFDDLTMLCLEYKGAGS